MPPARFVLWLGCFTLALPAVGLLESAGAGKPWDRVASDDLPTYAANLRAEGFPEEVVALLVSQALQEAFAARERALQPSSLTLEGLRNFWSRERRADGRLLHLEKQMLARAVLGIAPATTPEEDWFAQHLADLPARRRDIVRAIAADYQDLIELVRATSHGFLTTEDRQVIVFLEGERTRDLEEYLSYEQLLDFQIQHTAAGRLVLDDLFCFEPTPAELREYYQLMVENGLDQSSLEMHSPGATRRRVHAKKATVARLAEHWPEDRFVRLRFCLGPPYRRIYPLVHRLGHTTADADAVLAAFATLMDGIDAIDQRRPIPLNSPEVRAEIIGLYERHCEAVRAILGEQGFRQYYDLFSEVFSWNEVGQMHWMPINFTPL